VTTNGESILFAGDTAHTTAFLPHCRGRKIRVALLPIGDGYYRQNHATPEDAWDMFFKLEADFLLPLHWRTFILSPEPTFEPMKRLEACAAGNLPQVVCREVGQTFRVPASGLLLFEEMR
jgi:L-ascorbate metabolism protein UlaG (beta-lactamase superfamily)